MRGVVNTIHAFYYTGPHTSSNLPDAEQLLARLAPARRERFGRQSSTSQRAVSLAAWRLLELGMQRCGHTDFRLANVVHPLDGKPYWSNDAKIDFSLSHARGIAVCAIGANVVLGCDAEERKRIELRLTQRLVADNAVRMPCWTELEAVVKAAGKGIMHGRDIEWTAREAIFDGQRWWCYPIECGALHAAHVAVNMPDCEIVVTEVIVL
jgi:phosphopantetheinyl transferase